MVYPKIRGVLGFFANSIINSIGKSYYSVQDENGKVSPRYYPHARRITKNKGKFLLKYCEYIETTNTSLFWWLKHTTNLDAQIFILQQKIHKYFKRLGKKQITEKGWFRINKLEGTIRALQNIKKDQQ